MARGTHTALRSLVVRVYIENDIVGIGEAHEGQAGYTSETLDSMRAMVEKVYGPALIGLELESVELLHQTMVATRRGNPFARCALEMALFDALARARGISIAALLGGPVRRQLELAGSIGIDEPEIMAERAQAMVTAGYRHIRVKIGTPDISKDWVRVKKVRDAIGDNIALEVDANGGYLLADALILAKKLAGLGIVYMEQPVAPENLEAMARLTRLGAVPILADESVVTSHDAFRIIAAGAADAIKIKVSKCGGYIGARKIIDVAEAAGIKLIIGQGICSSIEAAGEIHLACAYPHVCDVADMVGPAKLLGDLVEKSLDMSRGTITLPQGVGLGLDLSEDRLREYALAD